MIAPWRDLLPPICSLRSASRMKPPLRASHAFAALQASGPQHNTPIY